MASATAAPRPEGATPMMAQYLALKAEAGDALLFFRMGDFYELFFADAEEAAALLDIALSHRGEHRGQPVPMAGVPVHAHEAYLARLVKAGRSVAIAEQLEDPAEARRRGSRAVVRRAIVRVLTPGTLVEERLLEERRVAWLAAACVRHGRAGLAFADVSTGVLRVADLAEAALPDELARLGPAELLVVEGSGMKGTARPRARFDPVAGASAVDRRFGAGTASAFSRLELGALGALLGHIEVTARGEGIRLLSPVRHATDRVMAIDRATRASLELAGGAGSLLAVVDRCRTAAGGRLLAEELGAPLLDRQAISERLAAIAWFVDDAGRRGVVQEGLKRAPDLARAVGRLAAGRGRPTDLAAVRDGLLVAQAIAGRLQGVPVELCPPALPLALGERLGAALVERPPSEAGAGGAIADGFDPALDAARALARDGRLAIAALEGRLREASGIAGLKVRHNGVLGWHVEVPARFLDRLKADGFEHRQTLGAVARFDTAELRRLAAAIAEAGARALALEADHLAQLTAAVLAEADAVSAAAAWLARLDRSSALAEVAAEHRWVRPDLTDGDDFDVVAGRHPVVEAALRAEGKAFVPNDCRLAGDSRVWLLTGPNMGGKSTVLRQNALIAVLAQAGSFVPADRARIGIVDRLFSRVGASDRLAEGQSTFMVEMVETAAILRQATARSLVLLDEVGRGTATWDGLAIAWAVLEAVAERGCRALFATHYHELTALHGRLPGLALKTVRVKAWEGTLHFLHEVADGAAPGSFGIEVARMAGVPDEVVARAREVLARLEAGEVGVGAREALLGLPLFEARTATRPPVDPLRERLLGIEPDELSPKAALELLYVLKALAGGPSR